jgi:hypothetical protein
MLLTNGFVIHLVIMIISLILSYVLYKYLNNNLIDISKLVKNDVEKFTDSYLNADMFSDPTAYGILESETSLLEGIKYRNQITQQMNDNHDRLRTYIR